MKCFKSPVLRFLLLDLSAIALQCLSAAGNWGLYLGILLLLATAFLLVCTTVFWCGRACLLLRPGTAQPTPLWERSLTALWAIAHLYGVFFGVRLLYAILN